MVKMVIFENTALNRAYLPAKVPRGGFEPLRLAAYAPEAYLPARRSARGES